MAEVFWTVEQLHCSRRRLLRKGLEFYVCTINKSAHTKNFWKLIVCPSYIYIYTYRVRRDECWWNPYATSRMQHEVNFFLKRSTTDKKKFFSFFVGWFFQPWYGNWSRRRKKNLNSNLLNSALKELPWVTNWSSSSEGHAADQRCLWWACKGMQALTPSGSRKKIWEEVLSLSICLSTHLSHTTETSTLSRIKCERYIFIKKCVRSFLEVRKLCLIMFPLIIVLRLYNKFIHECSIFVVLIRCIHLPCNRTVAVFSHVSPYYFSAFRRMKDFHF